MDASVSHVQKSKAFFPLEDGLANKNDVFRMCLEYALDFIALPSIDMILKMAQNRSEWSFEWMYALDMAVIAAEIIGKRKTKVTMTALVDMF